MYVFIHQHRIYVMLKEAHHLFMGARLLEYVPLTYKSKHILTLCMYTIEQYPHQGMD